VLGPIARGILHAFHVQPIDPHHPIPEYLVMSVGRSNVGTVLALLVRSRLSWTPGACSRLPKCF